MPLETTHKLTQAEASDIKQAVMSASQGSVLSMQYGPEALARGLIDAFRLIEEATASSLEERSAAR